MTKFLFTQMWFTAIVASEIVKWYAAAKLVSMYGGFK